MQGVVQLQHMGTLAEDMKENGPEGQIVPVSKNKDIFKCDQHQNAKLKFVP